MRCNIFPMASRTAVIHDKLWLNKFDFLLESEILKSLRTWLQTDSKKATGFQFQWVQLSLNFSEI